MKMNKELWHKYDNIPPEKGIVENIIKNRQLEGILLADMTYAERKAYFEVGSKIFQDK